jgi:hypothetical protein
MQKEVSHLFLCHIWHQVDSPIIINNFQTLTNIVIVVPTHLDIVATLTLGLWPRQGLAKVWAKSEAQESHFMYSRMWENVKEWTSTLPSELPLWELESQWCPKSSKNNCKGQNSLDWKKPYIIGKLLQRKCLKWVCMTHLST